MRLFHFTTDAEVELLEEKGFRDNTVWFRGGPPAGGVELSDTTRTDAYLRDTSWLVVLDVDERHVAPYESKPIARPRLRSLLRSVGLHAHGREWLVPAQVLSEHARVVEIGDFADPTFAARYRD